MQVRRERISDRLKALQLLIPNGDKVGSLKKSEDHYQFVNI